MEPVAFMMGIGIISAILLYLSFKLDEKHIILKLISLFMGILILMLIPKVLIDFPPNCEIIIDQQNMTDLGNNITQVDYSYNTFCGDEKTTGKTILKLMNWIYYIMMFYAMLFTAWYAFSAILKPWLGRKR